jgi:hypothetical protein
MATDPLPPGMLVKKTGRETGQDVSESGTDRGLKYRNSNSGMPLHRDVVTAFFLLSWD